MRWQSLHCVPLSLLNTLTRKGAGGRSHYRKKCMSLSITGVASPLTPKTSPASSNNQAANSTSEQQAVSEPEPASQASSSSQSSEPAPSSSSSEPGVVYQPSQGAQEPATYSPTARGEATSAASPAARPTVSDTAITDRVAVARQAGVSAAPVARSQGEADRVDVTQLIAAYVNQFAGSQRQDLSQLL